MVDKRACRMSTIVAAAGIGIALSTGYGVAAAEPSATDASGPGSSSDAGSGPSTGSETKTDVSTSQTRGDSADDAQETDAVSVKKHRNGKRAQHQPDDTADEDASSLGDTTTHSQSDPEADVVNASAAAPAAVTRQVTTKPIGPIAEFPRSTGVADRPSAPVEPPFLSALLAWARRQSADPAKPDQGGQAGLTTSTSTPEVITTINVRDYGAVGDGVTDDSAAIKAAEAAMTSYARLYFPEGDYRFAQQNPAGNAAILLKGLSYVTVEFDPGARLLMDNLAANGHGTSHGIRVEGAASHVTLLNPTIEWVTRPSARSFGDGISILGWPSDDPPPPGWTGSTGAVEFVSIINGRTVNSPQAGAVIMGASDATVTNFTAIGTLADGLHFNANRRVTVDGLVAQNTGDDGLAFVTYYDATAPWTYGPTDGPFNQSGLGEWNNGGSVASNITVSGGHANGFRVQGGYDITISDVTVTNTDIGFQVNSAIATGPGDWTSLASRNIDISDVTIDGVQTGIVLATNNIDGTEDSKWWDFSGVTISEVTILNAQNWSVTVETPSAVTSKFAGVTLRNIYAETGIDLDGPSIGGNGGILLSSLRDSVIDNVRLVSDRQADILLLGAGQIRGDLTVADLPSSNLTVNDLILEGPGRILIQDIAGVEFGNVVSYGAAGAAVEMYRVKDASFDNITAYMPGRGEGAGYGVRLLQVYDLDIAQIDVTTDDHIGSSWTAVELGGGNPTQDIAGRGVRVENVTYVSGRDATGSDMSIQGGPWGAVNWYINATWRHEGEATPQWRSALYGDTSPV